MSYLTQRLVLGTELIQEDSARLCYKNLVTFEGITATSELESFPVSNAANPSTSFGWEATSASTQTVTISNPSRSPVDYVGIARHNLGQLGLTITIKFNGSIVYGPSGVGSEQAILLLLESSATPETIDIVIDGATSAPKIAVIYAGESTRMERNIYVGHTPITYGRDRNVINGIAQSGDWLGEVVLNETLSTSVELKNLTPLWYRQVLDPYFKQKPRLPCFWAWRPGKYPTEIGYCWVEGSPRPVNQLPNGMMSMSWNFRGIGSL